MRATEKRMARHVAIVGGGVSILGVRATFGDLLFAEIRAGEWAYHVAGAQIDFRDDTDKDMHLTYEDVIDTLGKSILGLSIGCARCHNHKYDPVTTRDYYALYGIFASTRFPFPGCEAKQKPRDLVALPAGADVAYAVADGKPEDARLQNRGEPTMPGDLVARRNLELFGGQPLADKAAVVQVEGTRGQRGHPAYGFFQREHAAPAGELPPHARGGPAWRPADAHPT